jgi:hypothetical protein
METNGNKNPAKSSNKNYCEICNTKFTTKYNFNAHILTRKHKMETLGNAFAGKSQPHDIKVSDQSKLSIFRCVCCHKTYKTRSGLWKHNILCKKSSLLDNVIDEEKNNIIMKLLEQNKTLQNKIIEFSNEKDKNTKVTNITNNHFNLNVFLNEKCKDALNIMEFVNSLQLQIKDLESTGKLGYVEGISKIFINGLKELDLYKRPIHCSDVKREVFYIKDLNKWEKEEDENKKLKEVINTIAHKNIKQIPKWVEKKPEYKDLTSIQNDQYLRLVNNAMSGINTEEIEKNYNKIISNVAKEVVITKK